MYSYVATVRRVVDGDTVRVDIDLGFGVWLHNQSIRLAGIDAPELRGESYARGKESSEALRKRIEGKDVQLKTSKDAKGKYGRWLAVVYDDVGNVNDWLIAKGFAAAWRPR